MAPVIIDPQPGTLFNRTELHEARASVASIGTTPHGLFPGWYGGTWIAYTGEVSGRTSSAYPSIRMALLAAASALANDIP